MELQITADWRGLAVPPDEHVQVWVERDQDGLVVSVEAPFHGDPPPNGPPGPTWALWEHEVVEVFLVGVGEPVPYLEVELGPHGHHLVLVLEGVRNAVRHSMELEYTASIEGDRWTGRARIPAGWLPPAPLRLNAYAIHGAGAERRYLPGRSAGGRARLPPGGACASREPLIRTPCRP